MDIEKDRRSYASANNQTKRFLAEGAQMGVGNITGGLTPQFQDGKELVIIQITKADKTKQPGKLAITPEKLVLFKEDVSDEAIEKLVQAENDASFVLKIPVNDIHEFLYPALENLLKGGKFAVKVKWGNKEEIRFDMTESSFFTMRAIN